MTPADIIRMAQQVGYPIQHPEWRRAAEEFAAIVEAAAAAAEREKVARFIIEQCFSTGRSDSIEGMLDALVRQVAEREREACAKACDKVSDE